MEFRICKATLKSWDDLFTEAARIGTELGPARLRRISHSASDGRGIVTLWYEEQEEVEQPAEGDIPIELKYAFKRGTMISWEDLFQSVATQATSLRPEQLVSITHSDSKGDGIATLWYWDVQETPTSD